MTGDNTYLLMQLDPAPPVEIARTVGSLPLQFDFLHLDTPGRSHALRGGPCPCRPSLQAQAICDEDGTVLWPVPVPPTMCPGDGFGFDWQVD